MTVSAASTRFASYAALNVPRGYATVVRTVRNCPTRQWLSDRPAADARQACGHNRVSRGR
jgi:hypothetical protein